MPVAATKINPLLEAALEVAKEFPVFPTTAKKPTWSNAELQVKRGEGGFKIATQDPEKVKWLFSHLRATEISVPMGSMSGLLCVDVDSHRSLEAAQWLRDNWEYLKDTKIHKTRSGGFHFIFKHPGDNIRFPSTLCSGVDLKAGGNGYICWPGTEGYMEVRACDVESLF